jgi:Putative esterase
MPSLRAPPAIPCDGRRLHDLWAQPVRQLLVSYIDAHYRTLPSPDHRGLDGKSSRGYAALVWGMRNPQLFGAVASHGGDMYFEACYKADFWRAVDTIRKHGGLDGYLRAWREAPKKTDELVKPMVTVVCMAMAYSPNLERVHGFDLPFNPETGEIDEAVWARWLEWDPGDTLQRVSRPPRSREDARGGRPARWATAKGKADDACTSPRSVRRRHNRGARVRPECGAGPHVGLSRAMRWIRWRSAASSFGRPPGFGMDFHRQ